MKIAQIKKSVLIWGVLSKKAVDALKNEECVVAAECRPYLYGLKHNLILLNKEKIPYFYCTDNMLGVLFREGKIKYTFIFYKQKNKEGFLSPAGSLYVYLLSKLHNIEVKFIPQGKFDDISDRNASTLEGKLFVLEKDLPFVEDAEDELIEKSFIKEAQNV